MKLEPYEKIKLVANDLAEEVMKVHSSLKYQNWVPLKATADELELAVRRPTPEMIKWAEGVLAKPKGAEATHRLEQPYAERTIARSRCQARHHQGCHPSLPHRRSRHRGHPL